MYLNNTHISLEDISPDTLRVWVLDEGVQILQSLIAAPCLAIIQNRELVQ
jgi:hypothetical protein